MPARHVRGFVGLLAIGVAVPALGGTNRHDVFWGDHIDYGDGFRMIGGVQVDFSSFGTGVVINNEWVLTAAHVVSDATAGSYVKFETDPKPTDGVPPEDFDPNNWETLDLSGLFRVDAIAVHEFYDPAIGPAGGFDIALLHLDATIEPDHYPTYNRFTGGDEVGRTGTPVGFGALGDGKTGYVAETAAFFRVAGDNKIDALATHPSVAHEFVPRTLQGTGGPVQLSALDIASQFLLSDFDDPATMIDDPNTPLVNEAHTNDGLNILGDADPLALEYEVAPGDSGGPLLVDVNGVPVVAGINSFIYGPPAELGGDGTDNASYGDLAGYLRVSVFNAWIDGVIAAGVGAADGVAIGEAPESYKLYTGPLGVADASLVVPEPASLTAATAALTLLLRRRRGNA